VINTERTKFRSTGGAMDATRHAGKTAIVTGAGSGIGRATALRLAREGAVVVGCDIDEVRLEALSAEFDAASLTGRFIRCDVTQQRDVDELVAAAGERVDVLANVAGVMDHFVPLGELDDATWERVMAINLTGVMRLSRAVLAPMIAAGGGAIVTVASEASLSAGAAGVAYTTSKHAVIGLVRSIAFYYGPRGIRANAVLPGAVATDIAASASPTVPWAMERAMVKLASMPEGVADPDQIASVISFLASEEASNVNGAVVTADRGWSAA
jgi:NAD(P)-dependent dehydrogenase (short-subunit alcohol dehydrogenase family)